MMTVPKNSILFVSNGFGEDHIACNLIAAIQRRNPKLHCVALPLVGNGNAYKKHGITCLIQNPMYPSGGFLRRFRDWVADIANGAIAQAFRHLAIVKQQAAQIRLTICVGDVYCLCIGSLKNTAPVYFLPTAKSERFMPHTTLEYMLIRWLSKTAFPRDPETAKAFNTAGCSAQFLGNAMMDNLNYTGPAIKSKQADYLIGILPGSREEAYPNATHTLHVLEALYQESQANMHLQFAIGLAPSLSAMRLSQQSSWHYESSDTWARFRHPTLPITCEVVPDFVGLINSCDLIIGLAGTANEQALHVGTPVLCFEGFGPQSTLKRFYEQRQLMDNKLTILENRDPVYIAKHIIGYTESLPSKHRQKKEELNLTEQASDKIIAAIWD